MVNIEEYINGKSLDELLEEAKQEDIKREVALVKAEKKEGTGNYDSGLAVIVGEELTSQKYENFSDTLRLISDIEGLFYARGDISLVLKNLVELQGTLECIKLPKKLRQFPLDIRTRFVDIGANYYLKSLEHPSEEDLKIGSKVRTVFTPFFETKFIRYNRRNYKHSDGTMESTYTWEEYFNERNFNFSPGSLGKIVGFYTDNLIVQFDKEGKWSKDWWPDCDYWGEKKNVALYEPKELRFLPYSSTEICALKTLLDKVDDKLREIKDNGIF